jgi:hypothetical protein
MSEAHHDAQGEFAEEDRPNNPLIFTAVAITLISLVAVLIGVREYFLAEVQAEVSAKVLEPPNSQLRSLRALERDKLTKYQWISEKSGIVRIPLDKAFELTLKDYQEKQARAAQATPTTTAALPAGEGAPKPEDAAVKPEEGSIKDDKAGSKDDKAGSKDEKASPTKEKKGAAKDAGGEKPKAPKPAGAMAPKPPGPKPEADTY